MTITSSKGLSLINLHTDMGSEGARFLPADLDMACKLSWGGRNKRFRKEIVAALEVISDDGFGNVYDRTYWYKGTELFQDPDKMWGHMKGSWTTINGGSWDNLKEAVTALYKGWKP
jgi:hypothetical protein